MSAVISFGSQVFSNCVNLKNVVLPEGIKVLDCFENCTNIVKVNIPKSVNMIDGYCFSKSGIEIDYTEKKKNMLIIDNWLIYYKPIIGKLTIPELPSSLKYIGNNAFNNAIISKVKLPEGLLYVGQSAFRNTKLNEVEIPLSVEYVENWAFMNCEELESITVLGNTQFEWTALPEKNS